MDIYGIGQDIAKEFYNVLNDEGVKPEEFFKIISKNTSIFFEGIKDGICNIRYMEDRHNP